MHRQKAQCLLRLNHDCHAIIEKHIAILSWHLPRWPMISHCKRHQRIWVTNQLMDNFYVLSGILIPIKIDWKMFFLGILSNQCKMRCDQRSDTRRLTSRCDRPGGFPWYISMFKLNFFWLEFWTSFLKFYASNVCWKTVSVCTFCKRHSFTIFYAVIYSLCYNIYLLYFTSWLNAEALLPSVKPD